MHAGGIRAMRILGQEMPGLPSTRGENSPPRDQNWPGRFQEFPDSYFVNLVYLIRRWLFSLNISFEQSALVLDVWSSSCGSRTCPWSLTVLLALVVLACSTAKSSRYGAAKVAVAKDQRAFGEDAAEPPTASMSPVACGTSRMRGRRVRCRTTTGGSCSRPRARLWQLYSVNCLSCCLLSDMRPSMSSLVSIEVYIVYMFRSLQQ